MAKRKNQNAKNRSAREKIEQPVGLRIIGGRFRGRKLAYSGDLRTRPMKDRVREALFNLLGNAVKGKTAIDLFAGTGALGLEALSRGAAKAVFIERHIPTARLIRTNTATLGVESETEVAVADTFLWFRRFVAPDTLPWLVFCSPPYDFYVSRRAEMLDLLGRLATAAPAESLFAVEADAHFDFGDLPCAETWDVRQYPPAVLGIWQKT
jgi:16S rRNA (guanine966-N2)-methyltransferase